jgi:PLP dependent protein
VLSASPIADNLARVRDAISEACVKAGRQPSEVTLVGVSKTQPAEVIVEAVRAGLEHIGENRVQEAAAKLPRVHALASDRPLVTHLVGHLQTNKVKVALGLFDCIDSLDTVHLAQALGSRRHGLSDVPVLIEVYVGDDPARPGVRPAALMDTVGAILATPGIHVEGLMSIAPLGGDARAAFARVRTLKEALEKTFPRVHFGVLSMGMSDDFEAAIAEGSTQVRIGTALFGPRR